LASSFVGVTFLPVLFDLVGVFLVFLFVAIREV
jgi:hypothetical protein